VHGLVEELARVLAVALRPEVGHQPLSTPAPLAGDREEGEQRQAMTLSGAGGDRPVPGRQRRAAEKLEIEDWQAVEEVQPLFTQR
jgi:hypothetical protein